MQGKKQRTQRGGKTAQEKTPLAIPRGNLIKSIEHRWASVVKSAVLEVSSAFSGGVLGGKGLVAIVGHRTTEARKNRKNKGALVTDIELGGKKVERRGETLK